MHQRQLSAFSSLPRHSSTIFVPPLCYAQRKGGDTMPEEYTVLFNAIEDAIRILIAAQQKAEEIVISREEV